jgi:hypothetical protein
VAPQFQLKTPSLYICRGQSQRTWMPQTMECDKAKTMNGGSNILLVTPHRFGPSAFAISVHYINLRTSVQHSHGYKQVPAARLVGSLCQRSSVPAHNVFMNGYKPIPSTRFLTNPLAHGTCVKRIGSPKVLLLLLLAGTLMQGHAAAVMMHHVDGIGHGGTRSGSCH